MRLLAVLVASSLLVATLPAADPQPANLQSEIEAVLAKYSRAIDIQQRAMLGASMEADIDGRITGLAKHGKWKVMRSISRLGEITFQQVANFVGDGTVKDKLIAKYLEEEQKAKAYGAMNVRSPDYTFDIRAKIKEHGQTRYIFDVKPKKGNKPGAFKGEVVIDGETGMPLREAGELVESPSVWLSKIKFSRDYEMLDGISIVKKFRSSVHVRLLGVGQAELDIDFSNFQRPAPGQSVAGGF